MILEVLEARSRHSLENLFPDVILVMQGYKVFFSFFFIQGTIDKGEGQRKKRGGKVFLAIGDEAISFYRAKTFFRSFL